jgi:hypothetical protein
MNVTASTLIQVGIGGALEKTNHAGATSDYIWHSIFGYNPVLTPVMYSNGYVPVIDSEEGEMVERRYNPWIVATQTGYSEIWHNTINSNITLEQKLDFLTEGLKFTGRFGYDTYNYNYIQRRKNPEMWRAERQRDSDGNIVFNRMVPERLLAQYSSASGDRKEFLEAELIYGRNFGDHEVGSVLKYTQDNYVNTSNIGGDIREGIARRHQGLAGSVSYGYMNRYLFNFNFGYNGSENFAKGHQFGFFPAYSIAWNVAEESFVKDNIDWLGMFKIRYSDGKVGIDNSYPRFPYLPDFGNYTRRTGAGEQEV